SSDSTLGTFNPPSPTIATGQSSTTFTYQDTKAGTPTITASLGGLTSGTQQETATPGTATKLQILLPAEVDAPGTLTGKTAATPTAQTVTVAIANGIIINAVDDNWNVVPTATTHVTISSTDSNADIADDNGGGTDGNVTLASGTATLSSFTFHTAGSQTVT